MILVGLIGRGGIAQDVAQALRDSRASANIRLLGAIGRKSHNAGKVPAGLHEVDVLETLDDLLALRPAIIAEVAGQQAVTEHCEIILRQGVDCLLISTGALADKSLLDRLTTAALEGNSRILLPAGAVGGIDAIAAMRIGGLRSVQYRSIKPPAAWRGSAAEHSVDLDKVSRRITFYTGNAAEAALRFPQNANVAATVALAGLGFEATQVELVVDPNGVDNVHEIEASGAAGSLAFRLQGKPSVHNSRTSALTAFSVVRALCNEDAQIVV